MILHLTLLLVIFSFTAFSQDNPLLSNSTLHKLESYKYVRSRNETQDQRLNELVVCKLNVIKFYSSVYADNLIIKKSQICSEFKLPHSLQSIIKLFTSPNSIAIDIGSYKGLVSLFMSRLVRTDGIVLSFEPSVTNHRNLLNNIKLNNRNNVIPLLAALGNDTKKAHMIKIKKTRDDSRVITRLIEEPSLESVNMTTLDHFKVLSNVSIIFIDVHTLEDSVLQGASRTIKRNKPVVIVSIGPFTKDCVHRYTETVKLLSSLSYSVHRQGSNILALPGDRQVRDLEDFKPAKADGSDAKNYCNAATSTTLSPGASANTTRSPEMAIRPGAASSGTGTVSKATGSMSTFTGRATTVTGAIHRANSAASTTTVIPRKTAKA